MTALWLAACHRPDPNPRPRGDDDVESPHSATAHSAAPVGHSGHTGWPGPPRTLPTRWFTGPPGGQAGLGLWVSGRGGGAELVVGVPSAGFVARLPADGPSGPLEDAAVQLVQGACCAFGYGVMARDGELVADGVDMEVRAVGVPRMAGEVTVDDATWRLVVPEGAWPGFTRLTPCPDLPGADLCLTGGYRPVEVRTYRAGGAEPATHALRLVGEKDDGDLAVAVGDLDGDGVPDLVVGASRRGGGGAVAVVDGALRGDHSLWSSATALLVAGGSSGFGSGVSTGDLDGDGQLDLLVESAVSGRVSVFRGPLSGELAAADADWRFDDVRHAVVGDFDGDGVPDVATPHSVRFGPVPPRRYQSRRVRGLAVLSTDFDPDGLFTVQESGHHLVARDLDGDGADDLVSSDPGDDTAGTDAGLVSIWTGIGAYPRAP